MSGLRLLVATRKGAFVVTSDEKRKDISHELPDGPLPDAIVKDSWPFFIMGAIAGG
jgi:hypothetical protein